MNSDPRRTGSSVLTPGALGRPLCALGTGCREGRSHVPAQPLRPGASARWNIHGLTTPPPPCFSGLGPWDPGEPFPRPPGLRMKSQQCATKSRPHSLILYTRFCLKAKINLICETIDTSN